ncbi:MAG: hypothetical protein AB1861_08875 [Cyanobacteriota bacterium]
MGLNESFSQAPNLIRMRSLNDKCIKKMYYVLDEDHNPVAATLIEWAEFLAVFSNVRVAEDYVGNVRISTVFIGSNIHLSNPPLVFETMIFNAGENYQIRYATWDEAIAGHQRILELVNSSCS